MTLVDVPFWKDSGSIVSCAQTYKEAIALAESFQIIPSQPHATQHHTGPGCDLTMDEDDFNVCLSWI